MMWAEKVKTVSIIFLLLSIAATLAFLNWLFYSQTAFAQTFVGVMKELAKAFGPLIALWLVVVIFSSSLVIYIISRRFERDSKVLITLEQAPLFENILPILEINPEAAINAAFKEIEIKLRKIAGVNVGDKINRKDLINKVYGENGLLFYGTKADENIGVVSLLDGAFAVFRNPTTHSDTRVSKARALQIVALASLLISLIDESELRKNNM